MSYELKKEEWDAIHYICENSDGREWRIGDFLIKNDYGSNAYYIGEGGVVKIPNEIDNTKIKLNFQSAKNITELYFPKSIKSLSTFETGIGKFGSSDTIEKIVFEEGLQEIWGDACFGDCKKLTEVVLPNSLEYLTKNAFKNTPWLNHNLEEDNGCYYLGKFLIKSEKDIVFANVRNGTTMICGFAFKGCKSLVHIEIPDSVKIIGEQAFAGCSSLTEIKLSENITRIESSAFSNCPNLNYFEALAGNLKIATNAFGSDNSPQLYLPKYAFIPNVCLDNCKPIQKLFFMASYFTSKDRHAQEECERYEAMAKKMKKKLLHFIMEQNNSNALKNIAPIAITKKNIDTLIEQAKMNNHSTLLEILSNL